MRGLLTTQSQNCYSEQIQKEMLTRLAWKSRYAKLYPSSYHPGNSSGEPTQLPQLPRLSVPPLMRPASPHTRRTLYQDSSHHVRISDLILGRSLYLQRRGHMKPEEKFNFPLLSSWEYGWRLGKTESQTPSSARSSLVKNTFYARNGVFSRPTATDTLG
uniref:Si:ch211-193l2.10 n=1 Tax=Amphilophus citrinellus TaxID=61819 RepID=A0A3Q0SGC7_AMPCI